MRSFGGQFELKQYNIHTCEDGLHVRVLDDGITAAVGTYMC